MDDPEKFPPESWRPPPPTPAPRRRRWPRRLALATALTGLTVGGFAGGFAITHEATTGGTTTTANSSTLASSSTASPSATASSSATATPSATPTSCPNM